MFAIIRPTNSGNFLVTHAVGEKYYQNWTMFSRPSWERYCERNDIGIIVFNSVIPTQQSSKKNLYWEKFLIPKELSNFSNINNICYLDTDVIINPFCPNLFLDWKWESVNLISQYRDLPYIAHDLLRRKIAFYRNRYLSSSYPLDSALFMKPKELYERNDLSPVEDYACTGVFGLNVHLYADKMRAYYDKIPSSVITLDGGEEVHLNHFFQTQCHVNWQSYNWQAIWMYEMAANYSFLYERKEDNSLIADCIFHALTKYDFLHFAGSWESFCWRQSRFIFNSDRTSKLMQELEDFYAYRKLNLGAKPVGQVRPTQK